MILNGNRLISWMENEIAIADRISNHYSDNSDTLYNYAYFEGCSAMAQRVIDYVRSQPKSGDHVIDGGQPGTLITCPQCDGDGLLHKLDKEQEAIEPEARD